MRSLVFGFLIGLTACSPGHQQSSSPASRAPAAPKASPVNATPAPGNARALSAAPSEGPFTGIWEDCEGAPTPGECSRYVLVQHGARICGTWAYYANGYYDGRVIAEARSPTQARRVRVCGRPGGETSQECESGWETVDKPLRFCGDKVGDLDSERGGCYASYVRARDTEGALASLRAEPWVQSCLAGQLAGTP